MSNTTSLPRPSAVLWDMDGTLIDQTAAIIECFRQVVVSLGHPSPDPNEIRRSLGGPMASTMGLFISTDQMDAATQAFRALFPKIMFEGLIILPGALELIRAFDAAGIPQGILTNKHGETARTVAEHCGFSPYMKACVGNTDTNWHKPQAELTNHTLSKMQANLEGACLIGDSPTDVETATQVGLPCYAVATGAHSVEELMEAGAVFATQSLTELSSKFAL